MSLFRIFLYTLLGVAVVVGNYYGFHYGFVALTYPNDGLFVLGFLGTVLLLFGDFCIAYSILRKKKVNQHEETT